MAGYYATATGFHLYSSRTSPAWREPQLAALGSVLSQWSLAGSEHPLVSVPTGVGKTAIALAAPFLAGARRTLVVVPTRELRRQTVQQFGTQDLLRRIDALRDSDDARNPAVVEVTGRPTNWADFDDADVVVGIPASVSPANFPDDPPPPELFDLVIVDEAHHAPAATWAAILDHFEARALLLTATPHRRDRKRIPGKLVYYYPLRQALENALYQPVEPHLLDVADGASQASVDSMIAAEVIKVLGEPQHATSQFIVRAGTKARANELAGLYKKLGQDLPVLHSGLGPKGQTAIVDALRDGTHRGLVMVGMLIEGFDLPSLRVAAYHDKHKSLEPTAQLLGRLARVSDSHPQHSVLVAARDVDVYPYLQGVVRSLYAEDADWASVLPGIIDAYVQDDLANADYARSFGASSGVVDLAHIHPLRRATIREIDAALAWVPSFNEGELAAELAPGERFAGQRVLYAGTNPENSTLLVVTGERARPRWNSGDELDSVEYDLHVVSFRRAPRADQPDLLLVNSHRRAAQAGLLKLIGAEGISRPGEPGRIQGAFDSLERLSVSSVGVRSTYGAMQGAPSYRMFAGKAIESGLRDSDTAQGSLGHAMVQVRGEGGAFTAGVSTGKSKYWESRYTPLRHYEMFVTEFADRYWFPTVPPTGPLLPQISRGQTLVSWPTSPVLAVTIDYALVGSEWMIDGHGSVDFLDLYAGAGATALGAPTPGGGDRMPLAVVVETSSGQATIWTGEMDLLGQVNSTSDDLSVRRGHSAARSFADLLTERPPTVFFVDGAAVRGRELYAPTGPSWSIPRGLISEQTWVNVNIEAETKKKAAEKGAGSSIHEWLEEYLKAQPLRGRQRWILCNDGAGEIADYIVLETLRSGQIAVDLWHAKAASGASVSVRVGDFQEVTAQAIKSRRWPTDRSLWSHLAARLQGSEPPKAVLVDGHLRRLEVLLGTYPRWGRLALTRRRPSVVGRIGIVQPGLGSRQLEADFASQSASAVQIVQLLTVFSDAVLQVAEPIVLSSS